jgi:hypothetical protein
VSQVSEERSVLADMRMVQHFKIHMAQEERDLLGLMIEKSEYSRDKNDGGAWNMTLLPKDILAARSRSSFLNNKCHVTSKSTGSHPSDFISLLRATSLSRTLF